MTIVAIVCKRDRIERLHADQVGRLVRRYGPQFPLKVETRTWLATDGRCGAWRVGPPALSDAGYSPASNAAAQGDCLWISGYADTRGVSLSGPESADQLACFCRQFTNVAGVYSVFWASGRFNALAALTPITRLEPVYWAENDDAIIVGNRAVLVHLLANPRAAQPRYDRQALPAFLAGGFYAGECVPFAGVHLLPPNSALTIVDGRVTTAPLSDALDRTGRRELTADVADELAHAFIEALRPVSALGRPISLALTGGQDSRLIAAGLKAAGVPFDAYVVDYGAANATDVAGSIEVARRLGVAHAVRPPAVAPGTASPLVEIDLLRKMRDTLFVTDGMLSGYENVPRRSSYPAQLDLAGNGGELLRGGYAKSAAEWSRDAVRAYLLRTFGEVHRYVRPEAAHGQRAFLEGWVDCQPARLVGTELLDRFYLFYRCGRWSAAARAGRSTYQDLHQPFFDGRLIAGVQALRIEPRLDDRLAFELLQRLAPELSDLPFANKHWRFADERRRSAEQAEFPAFFATAGGTATGLLNLDWRTRCGTQLREEFRRQIFDGPAAEALFEVLDRRRLRRLFHSSAVAQPANKLFLFAVYTLAVLLSNEWLQPPTEGRVVCVDVSTP